MPNKLQGHFFFFFGGGGRNFPISLQKGCIFTNPNYVRDELVFSFQGRVFLLVPWQLGWLIGGSLFGVQARAAVLAKDGSLDQARVGFARAKVGDLASSASSAFQRSFGGLRWLGEGRGLRHAWHGPPKAVTVGLGLPSGFVGLAA